MLLSFWICYLTELMCAWVYCLLFAYFAFFFISSKIKLLHQFFCLLANRTLQGTKGEQKCNRTYPISLPLFLAWTRYW